MYALHASTQRRGDSLRRRSSGAHPRKRFSRWDYPLLGSAAITQVYPRDSQRTPHQGRRRCIGSTLPSYTSICRQRWSRWINTGVRLKDDSRQYTLSVSFRRTMLEPSRGSDEGTEAMRRTSDRPWLDIDLQSIVGYCTVDPALKALFATNRLKQTPATMSRHRALRNMDIDGALRPSQMYKYRYSSLTSLFEYGRKQTSWPWMTTTTSTNMVCAEALRSGRNGADLLKQPERPHSRTVSLANSGRM